MSREKIRQQLIIFASTRTNTASLGTPASYMFIEVSVVILTSKT